MEATSDGGVRHGYPWPRALPSVVGALQPFPIDGRVLSRLVPEQGPGSATPDRCRAAVVQQC